MPNVEEIRRKTDEARRQAADKIAADAKKQVRLVELSRLESIASLFDTPGWGALMQEFQNQEQGILAVMSAEEPISDRDLQLLRAEYVYVKKLLALDSSIKERIKLLKK